MNTQTRQTALEMLRRESPDLTELPEEIDRDLERAEKFFATLNGPQHPLPMESIIPLLLKYRPVDPKENETIMVVYEGHERKAQFIGPGKFGRMRVSIEGDDKAYREVPPDDIRQPQKV